MKKIVALVLCLALALSLCTTAFAANDKALYAAADLKHMVDPLGDANKWDYKVANKGQADDSEFTTYQLTYEAAVDTAYGEYFVMSDAASADYAIVKNGKVEAYFLTIAAADDGETWTTTGSEIKVYDINYIDDMDEETLCGKLFGEPKDFTYYKGANDKFYVSDKDNGDKLISVGGKAVKVTEITVAHDAAGVAPVAAGDDLMLVDHVVEFDYDVDDEGKVTYEDVECARCGKTVPYVTSATAAADKWGVNLFHEAVSEDGDETIYVPCTLDVKTVSSTTSTGSTSGSTVESAKTFDAGIALYAGMALASVAGSAVVIGKKKEF